MGTTDLGFPYPGGGDFVIDGDDAMEALATALNDFCAATSVLNASAQAIATGTDTVVTWAPGSSTLGSDFHFSGDNKRLHYTGVGRWFLVSVRGTWSSYAAGDSRKLIAQAHTGLSYGDASSYIDTLLTLDGIRGHRAVDLVYLDGPSDSYLDLTARQESGGSLNVASTLLVKGL